MKRFWLHKSIAALSVVCLIALQMHSPSLERVSGAEQSVKLAVIMYHGFNSGGSESTYVLNASSLESDIVWLKENGFGFVTSADLTAFCDYGKPLPEKCVMLTFDDGYLNNYAFAYPILQKHNVKVTVSPIAYFSDYHTQHPDPNTVYAHMTWQQIKEMSDSGLVDIQNHSYNMHSLQNGRKGSARAELESSDDYRLTFFRDLSHAHDAIKAATGKAPIAYAYPFGSYSPETRSLLRCYGYRLSFSCREGYSTITRDPDSLWLLRRFNRTPQKNAALLLSDY